MKRWIRNKHGGIVGITPEYKEMLDVMRNAKHALDGFTIYRAKPVFTPLDEIFS